MDNKITPITCTDKLCFKCLKENEDIKVYTVGYRGYGSGFDNFNTRLQLCNTCDCKDMEMWVNEAPEVEEGYCENYKYEDRIFEFVKNLPIQGRELFDNQCAYGACSCPMDSQDWLDVELEIAPDSVYKEYGMYSPSEIKAYKDRFPTCKNVYLKTYKDGSGGCRCDYGAYGERDGSCGLNISDKCYTCKNYEKKDLSHIIKEEKELYIEKSKLKKVEMYEWTCEVCGEIVHTHVYSDKFICSKCRKWYEIY